MINPPLTFRVHVDEQPELERVVQIYVAQQHADRAALWRPHIARVTTPSSNTPAFNQRRIRLIRPGSPTRCCTNSRSQSWLRLPKKFFKSASSSRRYPRISVLIASSIWQNCAGGSSATIRNSSRNWALPITRGAAGVVFRTTPHSVSPLTAS